MESFVEDLKHQVFCSLCSKTMIEPKLLQCFHTFCKSCIKRHAELVDQVNIFKCPRCSSQTFLQELNDVEDLQPSPTHSRILQVLSFVENQKICSVSASHSEALWQCLDCCRSLCDDCLKNHSEFTKDHQVISLTDLKKEDIEVMLKRESPCKTHTNQEVEWYCRNCNGLICLLCLRDNHHNDHKITSLQEVVTNERESFSKILKDIEKLSADEEKKRKQEEIALKLERDGEKAKEDVKKVTKELFKTITDREEQLLNEIQQTITKAKRNICMIRHTPAAQEYIKYFMHDGTASEMIGIRDAEYSKKFGFDPFEEDTNGMRFKPSEALYQKVNFSLGVVQFSKKAEPKMSCLKVESNLEAMKKAKLTVVLKTSRWEVADEALDDIAINISPENDVVLEEKHVTTDSCIEVTFTPCVPGQFTAEVQVCGNPVSNSPQVIDVKPEHIVESSSFSKLKEALNKGSKNLKGIAVNKTNSRIAVADWTSKCVSVFNMEGDLILIVGTKVKLLRPNGLAFLNETDLVIADDTSHNIQIVNTATGELIKSIGRKSEKSQPTPGEFDQPCGVHIDNNSNIIVTEYGNGQVQVFSKDGEYQYLFSISHVYLYSTVKHKERFYISRLHNSIIDVIDLDDNHSPTTVFTIGGKDYTDGQLKGPWGLAIDNDNNLLVCDKRSNSIYKFTVDGHYIGKTSELSGPPYYLAVLNDGHCICTLGEEGVFIF